MAACGDIVPGMCLVVILFAMHLCSPFSQAIYDWIIYFSVRWLWGNLCFHFGQSWFATRNCWVCPKCQLITRNAATLQQDALWTDFPSLTSCPIPCNTCTLTWYFSVSEHHRTSVIPRPSLSPKIMNVLAVLQIKDEYQEIEIISSVTLPIFNVLFMESCL